MNAIQQRAASFCRISRVTLAIVGCGTPVRKIRAGLDARGNHRTDYPRKQETLYRRRAGMKAHVAAHHGDQSFLADRSFEWAQTLQPVTERFLDEQMNALPGRG